MAGLEEIPPRESGAPEGMATCDLPCGGVRHGKTPISVPGFRDCLYNVMRSGLKTQDMDIMARPELAPECDSPEPLSPMLEMLSAAPSGKREKAHAMNRMLCSLLKELDQEFTEKQVTWTAERESALADIHRVQDQITVGQRVIGTAVDENQRMSKQIVLHTVFYVWSELLEGREKKKRATSVATLFQHGHVMHVDRILSQKRDAETYVSLASRLRQGHMKCCGGLTAEKLEQWVAKRNGHTSRLGYMQAVLMQKGRDETFEELAQRLQRDLGHFEKTYGPGKTPPSARQMAAWQDAYGSYFQFPFDHRGRPDIDVYAPRDQSGFLLQCLKAWKTALHMTKRVKYFWQPERAQRLTCMRDRMYLELHLRKIFYGWRVWKLLSMQGCEGLGSAIAVGPNAAYLRKQVAEGWLKEARMLLVKKTLIGGRVARVHAAKMRKVLLAWATSTQIHIQREANADHLRKIKLHSAILVTVFNCWSRQTWADAVERGVVAKVKASEKLAENQKAVWAVRIAELEGAVRHAKLKLARASPTRAQSPIRRPFYRPPRPT